MPIELFPLDFAQAYGGSGTPMTAFSFGWDMNNNYANSVAGLALVELGSKNSFGLGCCNWMSIPNDRSYFDCLCFLLLKRSRGSSMR